MKNLMRVWPIIQNIFSVLKEKKIEVWFIHFNKMNGNKWSQQSPELSSYIVTTFLENYFFSLLFDTV